jgi:serine/threonine-protein kinase
MGAVYLAEHMVIGRKVALKVLLGSVAANETAVARFEREAQAAARIGNDHILEIYDFGSLPDGSRYMVCEFLEGETLAARLEREGQLSPQAIVPIAHQLLEGLAAAHAAGVVHRDLKPENIFILRQKAGISDFVKIIDFGISKFQPLSASEGMQMTATGIVVGTPCYLSPEQARGSRDADNRSDLYAVGVIMYEAVTGQLPFSAQNVHDLLFKIVLENPQPLSTLAPHLDPAFARVIEIAMARDPENRFATAGAFAEALQDWASVNKVPLTGTVRITGTAPARSAESQLPTRALAPTPGTWADSKVSVAAFQSRSKPRTGLIAAGLGIGVLLAGAAFALLRGASQPSTAASAAPVASVSQKLPVPEPAASAAPAADLVVPPAPMGDPGALLAPPSATEASPKPSPLVATPAPRAIAPTRPKSQTAKPLAPPPSTGEPATAKAKQRHDYGY